MQWRRLARTRKSAIKITWTQSCPRVSITSPAISGSVTFLPNPPPRLTLSTFKTISMLRFREVRLVRLASAHIVKSSSPNVSTSSFVRSSSTVLREASCWCASVMKSRWLSQLIRPCMRVRLPMACVRPWCLSKAKTRWHRTSLTWRRHAESTIKTSLTSRNRSKRSSGRTKRQLKGRKRLIKIKLSILTTLTMTTRRSSKRFSQPLKSEMNFVGKENMERDSTTLTLLQ